VRQWRLTLFALSAGTRANAQTRLPRNRQRVPTGRFRQASFLLSLDMPGNPPAGLFGTSRGNTAPEHRPMQFLQFTRLHPRESIEIYLILRTADNS
jgi:hypothetical protein